MYGPQVRQEASDAGWQEGSNPFFREAPRTTAFADDRQRSLTDLAGHMNVHF